MYIWCTPLRQSQFELSEKKEQQRSPENKSNKSHKPFRDCYTHVHTSGHNSNIRKTLSTEHNLVFHTFGVTATFENILESILNNNCRIIQSITIQSKAQTGQRPLNGSMSMFEFTETHRFSKASFIRELTALNRHKSTIQRWKRIWKQVDLIHRISDASPAQIGKGQRKKHACSLQAKALKERSKRMKSKHQQLKKAKQSEAKAKKKPSIHPQVFKIYLRFVFVECGTVFFIVFKRFYTLAAHSISKQQRILATYTGRVWCMFE